jgi:hypothetical protein
VNEFFKKKNHSLDWNGILEKEINQNEAMNIIMPMFVRNININPLFKYI